MAQPTDGDSGSEGYCVQNTVLTYAVSPLTAKVVETVCVKLGVPIYGADDLTDLIAVPNFLMVCNLSGVEPAQLEDTYDSLIEVEGKEIALLFTEPPSVQPPERLKKHIVKTPAELDEETLRFLIIRRMSAVRRHVKALRSYDRKLFRLFFILRTIREKGFVYSRDFCAELGVTQRTITRDLELLMAMGEPIEYDAHRKGYSSQGEFLGIP